MLDRGCKLKDAASCYELGRVLYEAKIEDTERAVEVLADYCYASENKTQCMKVKTLHAKAFDNVMSRHGSDEIM